MATAKYGAIIVGGGHNGLVAANYLAKEGIKVLLLERRNIIGGCAVTEEIIPGFKFSRASYVYSLFRPQIISDLNLHKYGLELLPRIPSSFTPTPQKNGDYLLLGAGEQADIAEIAKFSQKDAEAYPKYNALMEKYSAAIRPLLDRAPPDLGLFFDSHSSFTQRKLNFYDLLAFAKQLLKLGKDLPGFIELVTGPANKFLDRWFESPILKATLGTDAIIGAMLSPSSPYSAYVLLHHVMCGVWCNVKGGMGGISQALEKAAYENGVEIRIDATVRKILTDNTKKPVAYGVELESGEKLFSNVVLSNAAPFITFTKLLDTEAKEMLPKEFMAAINTINHTSSSCKINVAIDKLPNFLCTPHTDEVKGGPHHRGTIHFETSPNQIEEAYQDGVTGIPSRRPVIELTLPSVVDPTIAPKGKHVALMFVQYVPYALKNNQPWTRDLKEEFADSVFSVIEEYAPGFKKSIIGKPDILTPVDLEEIYAIPGGNIFHGSMSLDQLFFSRPVPGWARYQTPVGNLFNCGAGSHPGGGVMGAVGRNCAQMVLKQIGLPSLKK